MEEIGQKLPRGSQGSGGRARCHGDRPVRAGRTRAPGCSRGLQRTAAEATSARLGSHRLPRGLIVIYAVPRSRPRDASTRQSAALESPAH